MLTNRTFLMTATALLMGSVATAQSTTLAAAPGPLDILSWVTWVTAVVVLLMAVITAGSLARAGRGRAETLRAAAAAGPAVPATPAPATLDPVAPVLAPTPVAVAARGTAEPVLV